MIRFVALACLLSCLSLELFAQGKPPVEFLDHTNRDKFQLTTVYKSTENQLYWKNRKPFEGYWQQDVAYTINANINERTDQVIASLSLEYTNNSPDTLTFVYFHLYQNAFQPGSYAEALNIANDNIPRWGPYEKENKGTVITTLKVNGEEVRTELDNTILKVWLKEALLPNTVAQFNIDFTTYFDYRGSLRRRMKEFGAFGYKHFNGVHWYPRIAVYDRKFGWCTDQHLGKEFYGDFGSFDVSLTFSDDYVVGATGALANPEEVFPGDLRERLDIKNFITKKWDESPSIVTHYNPAKRKTWKFRAVNVHDFAWTANPIYRIGEVRCNTSGIPGDEVTVQALVMEPHASRWQNAADYACSVISVYSRDFGQYAYNKIIVADAQDGMEYPMLTLDGGSDPGYRGLFAHEIGHNWFFGMVGSNETYRAALDEGFTQFLTVWAQERIDGPYTITGKFPDKYTEKYTDPEQVRYGRAHYGYIKDAIKEADPSLNTHSDDFGGALHHGGGYGNVYYKTASMLFNLQLVLGDELFLNAMKHYVNQWQIAHPYMEDFRNSIIQYTHVDLNWFFDQWLEATKSIDYGVKKVKRKGNGKYDITFKRYGEMQMPIDFSVTDSEGKIHNYHIPNNWFEKKTTATILPRWIGWGVLKPEYTAHIELPARLTNVQIDTSARLSDINMLNNSLKTPATMQFDSRVYNRPNWKAYELFVRPDIWYNYYDGIKAGVHLNGNYMQQKHRFAASIWLNTGVQKVRRNFDTVFNSFNPFSFNASYTTTTNKFIKGSSFLAQARYLDGLALAKLGFEIENRKGNNTVFAYVKTMYRPDSTDVNYLMYRNDWVAKTWNTTLNLGLEHRYKYQRGEGKITASLRSSSLASNYDYSQLRLEVVNHNYLWKFSFHTRMIAQVGTGSKLAPESALYAAGASPEEMMENKYTRSAAFFPQDFNGYGTTTNHFQHGGGLNLRGYAGYLLPYTHSDGTILPNYRANSGAAFNAELEFDRILKIRPKFTRKWLKISTYFFADAGVLQANRVGEKFALAELRADAGIGTAWTIKKWGPLNMEKPLTIRFDMPLVLSRTPDVAPDYVQFRWILGIGRAF